MATEATRETYQAEVLESERPVLVDLWGPRCGPCLELMPTVDALDVEFGDRLKVVKVDVSKNRRLAIDLKVPFVPTYIFYRGGQEVQRLSDPVTAADIRRSVEELVDL